jgi:trimethylamine--corrinoid protein Co-methyltransferase
MRDGAPNEIMQAFRWLIQTRFPPRTQTPDAAAGIRLGTTRPRRGGAPSATIGRRAWGVDAVHHCAGSAMYEVLDEEGLSLIERNADTVLEEIGIEFRDDSPKRIALWRDAGADVKGERVRFPKGTVPRVA